MTRSVRPSRPAAALSLLSLAVLCSCGVDEDPTSESSASDPVTAVSRSGEGPVVVTATLSPSEARLSDELELLITARAEPEVEVLPLVFGETYGDFDIVDFRRPLPKDIEGRREWRYEFRLEPARSGRLTIDPIPIRFIDRRGDEEVEGMVETEGLEVEIASVLETGLPSLAEARPAAPPLALPEPERPLWIWWLSGSAVVLVGGGLLLWWRSREVSEPSVPERTPSELAYLELRALESSGLVERDVKAFYVELTAIVRRFIERTRGVHAPEQTTEEFLGEIAAHPEFSDEERRKLRGFLESADLVKFAAMEPRPGDLEESFRRARVFVGLETEGAAA